MDIKYEYELIDIEFELPYELSEDRGVYAHEDGPSAEEETVIE